MALDWDDGERHFIVTERIPGEPLSESWAKMSTDEKESIAKQVADYLLQLHSIHSARMQGLSDEPIYSAFLFRNGYGLPHGPLSSNDELWADMDMALRKSQRMFAYNFGKVCHLLSHSLLPMATLPLSILWYRMAELQVYLIGSRQGSFQCGGSLLVRVSD
jgi:hypothetical protein